MLIFDKSVCGRRAVTLPALDVPKYNLDENLLRNAELNLPEVAEIDLVRHYIGLSLKAKGVDNVFYPLGSCTMKYNPKLNEVLARNPSFTSVHPLQPASTVQGSLEVMYDAAKSLAEITGMDEISLEPAAGAHGEYTSLQVIRKYHLSRGDSKRNKIIVPDSAHGTNPASAAMCGFEIINVKSDKRGNVDLKALKEAVGEDTAALMLTNPNTLGLLDEHILKITSIVHKAGGLVYYDGANLNAVMGVIRPGDLGFDVVHLNLHKTFSTPHGGGGPGIGPIGVAEHLVPFLPGHLTLGHEEGAVASAAWGSASIAAICWMYLSMMGPEGLKEATEMAILNANYIAKKLGPLFPVLYSGNKGLVAHECILDPRQLTHDAGLTVDDIAKRLMDYGFHGPTMSFPVPGTLMVEPTESEPKEELDRFIEAMERIHAEITAVINGTADKEDNVLKNSPHTAEMVSADEWRHPYSRSEAAYPVAGLRIHKFWPYVGRVDNVYGDRNLVCTCDTVEEFSKAVEA